MLFCLEIPKTQRYISIFEGISSDEKWASEGAGLSPLKGIIMQSWYMQDTIISVHSRNCQGYMFHVDIQYFVSSLDVSPMGEYM